MPHFYFHQIGCAAKLLDRRGISLPDLTTAKAAAQLIGAIHLHEAGHAEPSSCEASIEVCDEGGTVVHLEWCRVLVRTLTAVADKQRPAK